MPMFEAESLPLSTAQKLSNQSSLNDSKVFILLASPNIISYRMNSLHDLQPVSLFQNF